MGNEESLVGFPVKQVVPALVSKLFKTEHTVQQCETLWHWNKVIYFILFYRYFVLFYFILHLQQNQTTYIVQWGRGKLYSMGYNIVHSAYYFGSGFQNNQTWLQTKVMHN